MDENTKKKTGEEIDCLIKRLEMSQTNVEQYAFKALNQHDKIYKLYTENIEKIMGMLSFLEGISFETTNLKTEVDNLGKVSENKNLYNELSNFFLVLSGQQEELQEICRNIQNIIEHQSKTSDIVHKLEGSIAIQRSNLEKLFKFYYK